MRFIEKFTSWFNPINFNKRMLEQDKLNVHIYSIIPEWRVFVEYSELVLNDNKKKELKGFFLADYEYRCNLVFSLKDDLLAQSIVNKAAIEMQALLMDYYESCSKGKQAYGIRNEMELVNMNVERALQNRLKEKENTRLMTADELLKTLKINFDLTYYGKSEDSYYFEKTEKFEWYVEISLKEQCISFPSIQHLQSAKEQLEKFNEYEYIFDLLITHSGVWWELGIDTPLNIKYRFDRVIESYNPVTVLSFYYK